eukprot:g18597.t1
MVREALRGNVAQARVWAGLARNAYVCEGLRVRVQDQVQRLLGPTALQISVYATSPRDYARLKDGTNDTVWKSKRHTGVPALREYLRRDVLRPTVRKHEARLLQLLQLHLGAAAPLAGHDDDSAVFKDRVSACLARHADDWRRAFSEQVHAPLERSVESCATPEAVAPLANRYRHQQLEHHAVLTAILRRKGQEYTTGGPPPSKVWHLRHEVLELLEPKASGLVVCFMTTAFPERLALLQTELQTLLCELRKQELQCADLIVARPANREGRDLLEDWTGFRRSLEQPVWTAMQRLCARVAKVAGKGSYQQRLQVLQTSLQPQARQALQASVSGLAGWWDSYSQDLVAGYQRQLAYLGHILLSSHSSAQYSPEETPRSALTLETSNRDVTIAPDTETHIEHSNVSLQKVLNSVRQIRDVKFGSWCWFAYRSFVIEIEQKQIYDLASWGVGVVLTVAFAFSLLLVYTVLQSGTQILKTASWVGNMIVITSLALLSLIVMNQAVLIWEEQQRHVFKLRRLKTKVSLVIDEAHIESARQSIDDMILMITEHDPPPKVFGIPMRPTLYNIISGYFISVSGIVIAKAVGM